MRSNIFFVILLLIVFGYLGIKVVTEAYCGLPSFDGAMNLQIPLNVVEYGRYATSYNGFEDFGRVVKTGAPLLLPIALFFSLFGISSFTALLPGAIYLFALGVVIYMLVKELTGNKWVGLFSVLILLLTPQLFNFGMRVYGEIPTLFFIFLGLLLLLRI